MKNDFSFIPKMNKDGTFTSKVVIKQENEVYKKLNEYCLTQMLEPTSSLSNQGPSLQTTAKDIKNRSKLLAAFSDVSFDLSHRIVRILERIPLDSQIFHRNFSTFSDLIRTQIARKERLLKQLTAQYQDVLVTAKNAGKSPSSVRCALLLNPKLEPNPILINKNTGELENLTGCETLHKDIMLRYYLKRFKENIQQKALFKKHVMGYFWVKCHLKNQNSVYLHMNMYIDNKYEEINVINMIKDVWENVSTETKPGERQAGKILNTPRKSTNIYYSPKPGGVLFYTKNKNIPLKIISNNTAYEIADASGVNLATLSGTGEVIPMTEDFDGTLSVTNKKVADPLNQKTFPAYLLHLAKASCFLPWSDTFAASKISGSTKK